MRTGRKAEALLAAAGARVGSAPSPLIRVDLNKVRLEAPNGTRFTVSVNNGGALLTEATPLAAMTTPVLLATNGTRWELSASNNGALLTASAAASTDPYVVLQLLSQNGTRYEVSLNSSGALLTEAV